MFDSWKSYLELRQHIDPTGPRSISMSATRFQLRKVKVRDCDGHVTPKARAILQSKSGERKILRGYNGWSNVPA